MTDENTRASLRTQPSDSVVEALRFWNEQSLAWLSTRYDHAKPSWMETAIAKGTAALKALASQPRDDVREMLDAAREDMAMCVAEMSKARGRIEALSGCNDDRRIAAALGSTCDHLRRRWFDLGTRIDTAFAPTTQGTDSGLAGELERLLRAIRDNGLSIPGEPAWAIEQDRNRSANRQFDTWCRENADTILTALRATESTQ